MLKITVIGGGSTYTPELIQGFLERQKELPVDEVWLMDIDPQRLEIVGGFAQRMATAKGARFSVCLSQDRQDSIEDATYIITQLRVGQMAARREDEYLGKRHNLIGQETTGIGGMAKALRTIPVILEIAEDIRRFAPQALLINFTNPAGLITEALSRIVPDVSSVGVCNASLTTKMEILRQLNDKLGLHINPKDAHIKALGLNHLTWFYGFEVDGQDYWPEVMRQIIKEMQSLNDPLFDANTLQTLGMLPNSYLKYYYYTTRMLEKQNYWPPSRAEEVMKIEEELLKEYQQKAHTEPPGLLMKRGGAYYSTVATQLINAYHNDLRETHILNIKHKGAVPSWDKDWVLEMPFQVGSHAITPIQTDALPLECESLITRVKAYELLTVEAAVHGDRKAAYKALLSHPLGPPADKIKDVLDDLLETNREFLPQFFT